MLPTPTLIPFCLANINEWKFCCMATIGCHYFGFWPFYLLLLLKYLLMKKEKEPKHHSGTYHGVALRIMLESSRFYLLHSLPGQYFIFSEIYQHEGEETTKAPLWDMWSQGVNSGSHALVTFYTTVIYVITWKYRNYLIFGFWWYGKEGTVRIKPGAFFFFFFKVVI